MGLRSKFILLYFLLIPWISAQGQVEILDSVRNGVHQIMIDSKQKSSFWIGEKEVSSLYRVPVSAFTDSSSGQSLTPVTKYRESYKSKKVSLRVWNGGRSRFIITNQDLVPVDLNIAGDMYNLEVSYGNFGTINYRQDAFDGDPNDFEINKVSANTLIQHSAIRTRIYHSNLKFLDLSFRNNDSIKTKLFIKNCKIDSLKISGSLPDTIIVEGLDLSGVRSYLDLSSPKKGEQRVVLAVRDVDISKIKFNLGAVWVYLVKGASYDDKISVLQQMVKLCRDRGYNDDAAHYDKLYQSEKYLHDGHWILDYISWIWWDYGYDKGRVFYISLILFTFFSILNLFMSSKIREVYWPERFIVFDYQTNIRYTQKNLRKKMRNSMGMILFTAYIFWGVKLDIKELEIRNKWILLLIIAQYVTGIICIAYLANFVISR